MEFNKKILIIIIAIAVIIIAIGAIFTSGFFNTPIEKTTPFDNNFTSGDFVGNVKVVNKTNQWAVAYSDTEHKIDYNMSTCKNATLIADIYLIQGMEGPEHRTFNDNDWDIYHAQGMQASGNNTNKTNNTVDIYMCVANQGEQSYIIYAIFNNNTLVNTSGGLYSQAYEEYIEPLLDTVTLKENPNVPEVYDVLGMDESTYHQYTNIVDQVKKGNRTAIEQFMGTAN